MPLLLSTLWFCFWGESWSYPPGPLFLLGLRACQTYVIQEIPLLGPNGVTIATGTQTCRCRPRLCTCSLAPLDCCEVFVVMVGGTSQVYWCCPKVLLEICFLFWGEFTEGLCALKMAPINFILRDSLPPWYLIISFSFSFHQDKRACLWNRRADWECYAAELPQGIALLRLLTGYIRKIGSTEPLFY